VRVHREVLPGAQQAVLGELGPGADRLGFYLGGGTAVALRTGHRRSVDLDWFTERAIADPLHLASELRRSGLPCEVESVDKGTLHATVRGIRVSFLEFPYSSLRDPERIDELGCRLAAEEDLVCMKLAALAGRGAKKDFIDVYALGRSGFSLGEMLKLYQSKFETLDVGHVIMSLTYFDDARLEPMPEMLWDLEWDDVEREIEAWVLEYESSGADAPGAS